MAHFNDSISNLMDTTPLKRVTTHGGDDFSISELSTTPRFQWMGDVVPATPESQNTYTSSSWNEPSQEEMIDGSFEETVQFEQSVLQNQDEEIGGQRAADALRKSTSDQELDNLKYTLHTMNGTIEGLNGFLRAALPKFERMQRAIDTWDGLSKQYNEIMMETERTAQILEDPSWPGRDQRVVTGK
ncbi:hypothetical protein CPB86DRAFT_224169 [Serendipita vermifera]|nr:hypothetical protein CPB86DRAFT_224169 [Serendipita vermifera]